MGSVFSARECRCDFDRAWSAQYGLHVFNVNTYEGIHIEHFGHAANRYTYRFGIFIGMKTNAKGAVPIGVLARLVNLFDP